MIAVTEGKLSVGIAKGVAIKHGLRQVLLIGFDGEQVHVVTYGKTKKDCEAAAKAQDFWTGKIREFSFKGDYTANADMDKCLDDSVSLLRHFCGSEWGEPLKELRPSFIIAAIHHLGGARDSYQAALKEQDKVVAEIRNLADYHDAGGSGADARRLRSWSNRLANARKVLDGAA